MTAKMRNVSATVLTVLLVCTVVLFGAVPELHKRALDFETAHARPSRESMLAAIEENTARLKEAEKMPGQLRVAAPGGRESITVENDYVSRTVHIRVDGVSDSYFDDDPMVGTVEHIKNIYYESVDGAALIDINLDSVYELQTIRQDDYLFLSFVEPRKIYDKIVVIDAGHGGSDKGAGSWEEPEKEINLNIVLQMKELFDEGNDDIGVYYTRLSDEDVSVYERAALAEGLGADLFLSVHNNSLSGARNAYVNGTEVMYRTTDESGASAAFATTVLEHLTTDLETRRIGLISGDTIYIVRTAEMPVALAEIGFMSNPEELSKLLTPAFQKKAAKALYEAVVETVTGDAGTEDIAE